MDLSVTIQKNDHRQLDAVKAFVWNDWVYLMLIFAVGFVVSSVLLTANDGFISTDDYYHARMAAQIIEQGNLRVDFPWLPLTILSPDQFVDHHLLYHIYLSPWVFWGGIGGAKIAQSLIVAGIFAVMGSLLRYFRVRYFFLWTVALLGISAPFFYRILMVRTQGAALLLLLIALHLLLRKHYRWLVALAFAFTWLYNGFVLLPAVVFLYVCAVWIEERRLNWQVLVYTGLGMILGLVVNPYFPQNILFIINHLGEKVDIQSSIRVGSEWYPYTTAVLLENSPGAFLALVAGFLASSFRKSGRTVVETTVLLISLLTLFMTFESRRFIEYFPPFALLFCAAAWGGRDIQWRNSVTDVLSRRLARKVYLIIVLLLLTFLVATTANRVYRDTQNAEDVSYMAGASQWLREHTEPSSLVFQTDWDDFTYLYYFNTHNTYLVGLDPTYLQVANPTLWNLWVAITQGTVERPSTLIRDNFGAAYVVSDTRHDAFAARADNDPDMRLVYRDDNSLIWQIKDTAPES